MKQYISPTFDLCKVTDQDVLFNSMSNFGNDWGVDDGFEN